MAHKVGFVLAMFLLMLMIATRGSCWDDAYQENWLNRSVSMCQWRTAPSSVHLPLDLPSSTAEPIITALSATMPMFPDMAISPFSPPPADSDWFERPPLALLRTPADSMDVAEAAAGIFPIAVVACNRPRLLERTLASLLVLPGIERSTVTVFQDGANVDVASVANSFLGVQLVQRPAGPSGASAKRIAAQYRFTLTQVFARNPSAAYAIIVEDDMIFSPDFLAFFAHTYRLYEMDPSVYCISSWNDNGKYGLVKDANRLLRTEFFAGLGWLASRTIYKSEFELIWPSTHWDHWMRDEVQRKGRECVYPEISRNYNIGVRGTHSDDYLFKRYFELTHHNTLPSSAIRLTPIEALARDSYNAAVGALIRGALPVATVAELSRVPSARAAVLFYPAQSSADAVWKNELAPLFGLWDNIPHIRGNCNGVQRFWWKDKYVLLVATYSPYARQYMHMNKDIALFGAREHDREENIDVEVDVGAAIFGILQAAIDELCHDACLLQKDNVAKAVRAHQWCQC
jgi:hypothetical protein